MITLFDFQERFPDEKAYFQKLC